MGVADKFGLFPPGGATQAGALVAPIPIKPCLAICDVKYPMEVQV